LDDPTAAVWQYQSIGQVYQPPLAIGALVTWTTDRGHLYFGDAILPRVLFRIETNDEIVSAPTSHGEHLYATSLGGYLYCYERSSGAELWRFSSGMPITKQPVVIDGRVYVASEAPALHAIDAENGRHLWTAKGVVQFVAQGADRVYGVDRFGTLMILDGESGTLAGRIVTGDGISALANGQSDRIYLVADTGLVQCYHEQGASEPTSYLELPDEQQMSTEGDKEATPAAEPIEEPVEEAPEQQPAEEPQQEENPFDDSNPFG
jgi:outer membrane protein assembly factor BamB